MKAVSCKDLQLVLTGKAPWVQNGGKEIDCNNKPCAIEPLYQERSHRHVITIKTDMHLKEDISELGTAFTSYPHYMHCTGRPCSTHFGGQLPQTPPVRL